MFTRLGDFVSRHWLTVIVGWVLVVALLRWVSPAWDDVTRDGDLAYLPDGMPSVVGEQLLTDAFPLTRAKSHIAFFVARDDRSFDQDDQAVADDLARRLKNLHGVAALARGDRLAEEAERLGAEGDADESESTLKRSKVAFAKAKDALDEAVWLDEKLAEHWEEKQGAADEKSNNLKPPARLAAAYHNRSLANQRLGEQEDAATDRQIAIDWDPLLAGNEGELVPEHGADLPILDVWTWRDELFGKKLSTKRARLVIIQLSNEFMATDNIRVLDYLEAELETLRQSIPAHLREKLHLGFSGSAAVGGDMLRAAKESIKNTELFTVVLVVLILGLVYRSPLLVAMPLVTIIASLVVATCVVALLTQVGRLPGFEWWNFKVFTTTRIFIVVILFGAGTDYFLFLASRYKEELERGYDCAEAVARALAAVGDALAASALTTIVGLGTMFFADFGKFTNSGPAIGLCLVVTLAACITLAPALLRAFGGAVFWPFGMPRQRDESDGSSNQALDAGAPRFRWLWEKVAGLIVARPGLILVCSVVVLLPLAGHGLWSGDNVTYDFFRQLPRERPSRWGGEVMSQHFQVGESGPLTVVAYLPDGELDAKENHEQIGVLAEKLYVDGVKAVRSITDPLGEFPPDKEGLSSKREWPGLFKRSAWRKRVASSHPRVQELFVATYGPYAGEVTRFDLILEHDPFSVEAARVMNNVEEKLRTISQISESEWHGATFAYTGTTAGIRDLKLVTQSDNKRIQILVVLAVFGVLLAILRRPLVCLYMIATVLFSYYVTIGATEWFFAWAYGSDFQGLDWKVPLFLFVILVAIGQDYNVYLATRVFEEQERRGPLEGLRFAVIRTGGIITSCGVIMAGTFSSMTSGTWGRAIPEWLPLANRFFATEGGALPAIVQLGFALSLGVMLDTFIVRPVLVPSFLALVSRWQRTPDDDPPATPDAKSLGDRSRKAAAKVTS